MCYGCIDFFWVVFLNEMYVGYCDFGLVGLVFDIVMDVVGDDCVGFGVDE